MFLPQFFLSIRPRRTKKTQLVFLSSLEHSAKGKWRKMATFFFVFPSYFHGNGEGKKQLHTSFPFSISLFPILLIIFYPTYLTRPTCSQHVSTHSMAGHYILGRGNLTCKSPFSSTCTNRSSCIDLSHFKIFSYKSYWLNSHAID